jgi:hypothetical protein
VKRLIAPWALSIAALIGCDARAGENYRGEVLLQMKGSLLLEQGDLAADSVPALAFWGKDSKLHILDVETHGEFPASFSIDVLSPPPQKAMQQWPEMPSYAVAQITALPANHAAEIPFPERVDGDGGFSWCLNPDNTDCYRRIEQCIAGTDQCYRELARCTREPSGDDEGTTKEVCDEILEQSGDPSIANIWTKFAGLSTDYVVLYVAGSAAAGDARKYISNPAEDGSIGAPAVVFRNEPIAAGYHLIHVRESNEMERAADESCADRNELEYMSEYNAAHGTSFERPEDLEGALREAGEDPLDHPDLRDLRLKIVLGAYDRGCLTNGVKYERVDPQKNQITVTLGTRDISSWSL